MADRKINGMSTKPVSRSDVRKATINGLRQVKANPKSVKLSAGQRRHITAASKRAS